MSDKAKLKINDSEIDLNLIENSNKNNKIIKTT